MRNSFTAMTIVMCFLTVTLATNGVVYSQMDSGGELCIHNKSGSTRTFDATATDNVRWERDGETFETTLGFRDVTDIQIPTNHEAGWDFVDDGDPETGKGTLAYSKYKIWTGSDYIYLDYRDTYYIAGQWQSLDVYLYYLGAGNWKCVKTGLTDTLDIGNCETLEIWTPVGRDNPDQVGFKIPVTVDNNFDGGQVKIDDINRSTPYEPDWSLYSSHSISALTPQTVGGGNYLWCAWSDDGAQTHNISVDGTDYSLDLTAEFVGTYIEGPAYLSKGQTGTYDCNPTCASGNCSYQWYKRFDGSDYWYTLGTNQTQQITMTSTAFTGKAEVTDDTYDQTAMDTYYVTNELFDEETLETGESVITNLILETYPNPCNPATTISYALPEDGHVSVKVYDMLGREVTTLVDGWMPSGKHTATFDGGKLASGTYVVRLQCAGQLKMAKVTLVK